MQTEINFLKPYKVGKIEKEQKEMNFNPFQVKIKIIPIYLFNYRKLFIEVTILNINFNHIFTLKNKRNENNKN